MDGGNVKRRPGNTASLIYDELRTNILSGELAPGTPLSQLSIAKTSGTSRGPVREALRRLQQDQLVVAHANHRFNVAPFDLSDLEAVLSLHLSVVTLAIRVGVPFLTEQDANCLESYVEAMERALNQDDGEQWETAYRQFIVTIVAHAGERTTLLASQLHDDIQRYRANLPHKVPSAWYSGGRDFRQIAQAAASRDAKLAATLYADYMGRLSSLVLASASHSYDASRLRGYISALLPATPK